MDSAPPPASGYGSNINSTRSDSVDESILRKHVSSGLPEPLSEERAQLFRLYLLPRAQTPPFLCILWTTRMFTIGIKSSLPSQPRMLSPVMPFPQWQLSWALTAQLKVVEVCRIGLFTLSSAPHTHQWLSARPSHVYLYHVHRCCKQGTSFLKITRLNRLSILVRARILLDTNQTATPIVSGTCCLYSFTDRALPLSMDCGKVPASWMLSANRDFSGTHERARTRRSLP